MKQLLFFCMIALSVQHSVAQDAGDAARKITEFQSQDSLVAPLWRLASDDLKGRYYKSAEINIAADYIASEFARAGARPVTGAHGYFQEFEVNPKNLEEIPGGVGGKARVKNVIAYIPGTDPILSKEYVLLSSHYDHLGVGKATMEEGKLDSIYNGARDNASGTTAVIDAARYFGKYPPKRSILLICYTAEEEGLLGSFYYAEHPLVPIKSTVYNLNIDNASYDDTTLITLVGLGRTTADSMIINACAAYGMHVGNDPTGGMLFSGSDNFPLAQKGVPAPTYSLGMKAFDETIMNRYHRLSDEPGNMDMAYFSRFIRAYILSASFIADAATAPHWTPGDKLAPKGTK